MGSSLDNLQIILSSQIYEPPFEYKINDEQLANVINVICQDLTPLAYHEVALVKILLYTAPMTGIILHHWRKK